MYFVVDFAEGAIAGYNKLAYLQNLIIDAWPRKNIQELTYYNYATLTDTRDLEVFTDLYFIVGGGAYNAPEEGSQLEKLHKELGIDLDSLIENNPDVFSTDWCWLSFEPEKYKEVDTISATVSKYISDYRRYTSIFNENSANNYVSKTTLTRSLKNVTVPLSCNSSDESSQNISNTVDIYKNIILSDLNSDLTVTNGYLVPFTSYLAGSSETDYHTIYTIDTSTNRSNTPTDKLLLDTDKATPTLSELLYYANTSIEEFNAEQYKLLVLSLLDSSSLVFNKEIRFIGYEVVNSNVYTNSYCDYTMSNTAILDIDIKFAIDYYIKPENDIPLFADNVSTFINSGLVDFKLTNDLILNLLDVASYDKTTTDELITYVEYIQKGIGEDYQIGIQNNAVFYPFITPEAFSMLTPQEAMAFISTAMVSHYSMSEGSRLAKAAGLVLAFALVVVAIVTAQPEVGAATLSLAAASDFILTFSLVIGLEMLALGITMYAINSATIQTIIGEAFVFLSPISVSVGILSMGLNIATYINTGINYLKTTAVATLTEYTLKEIIVKAYEYIIEYINSLVHEVQVTLVDAFNWASETMWSSMNKVINWLNQAFKIYIKYIAPIPNPGLPPPSNETVAETSRVDSWDLSLQNFESYSFCEVNQQMDNMVYTMTEGTIHAATSQYYEAW